MLIDSSASKIVMLRVDGDEEEEEIRRRRASMQPPGPAPMMAILRRDDGLLAISRCTYVCMYVRMGRYG